MIFSASYHQALIASCSQSLEITEASGTPNVKEYAMSGGKEILEVLQSASDLIPVPLLNEALGIAIKILTACEVSYRSIKHDLVNARLTSVNRKRRLLRSESKTSKNVLELSWWS